MNARREFWFLLSLATVQFLHIVDFMIVMPLAPSLMRVFLINSQQFSFVVSAYSFAAGVSGLVASFFIDRFDRKKALQVLFFGFVVSTAFCGIAPTYQTLVIARAMAGLFGGVLGGLTFSMVGDAIPFERRGRAMGLIMTSFSLASVIGVPFSLGLANHFEWHAPFFFIAIMGILILALLQRAVPSMKGHITKNTGTENPMTRFLHLLSMRPVVLGLLLSVIMILGQFIIIPFISPSMVANVKIPEKYLFAIYFCGGAATIFSSPWVGRQVDRIGALPVFVTAMLINIIPVYFITHMGPNPLWAALVATTAFFVTANARMVPYMSMVTAQVSAEYRGAFMALNSSIQSMATSAAAFLSGMMVVQASNGELLNYQSTFYFGVVATILGLWVGPKVAKRPVNKSA